MKKGRFFCALALGLLLCMTAVEAFALGAGDCVRLHVLAQSDARRDQEIKLCVRDAVREAAQSLLEKCENAPGAYRLLSAHIADLQSVAACAARDAGFYGDVQLEMGCYAFPDRVYAGELVSAGDYHALRVVLGTGKGKNWWCVLYPAMCLPEDADVAHSVTFYSSIWRTLCAWFGGEAR